MATPAANIDANPPEKQRLRSLPGAKSKVWKFFGFCEGEMGEIKDTKTVVCRLCDHSMPGNTTNLLYHLQTSHPAEHMEIAPKKSADTLDAEKRNGQATISGCFSQKVPYPHGGTHYKVCEDSLVEFVCKDFQALHIERPAFLQFVQTLHI